MKTITVVSGKGGTGKTSIVASFAALAGPVMLADCDVDAADLHLILDPQVNTRNPFTGGHVAEIDPDRCTGCGGCQEACRFDAIRQITESSSPNRLRYEVDPIACEGCGVCERVCPEEAVSMKEERSGEWYVSDTRCGPMVHARLGIAAENSGKLVSIVRTFAKGIAQSRSLDYVIIDGPPGIGCPVIASITGSDFTLIVTEPTLSGQHDLQRIADLTAHFGIPTRVCINKWDLNEEISRDIEDWGRRTGNQVLGRIRFDNAVTHAQLAGRSVVEAGASRLADDIRSLWDAVREEIGP